MVPHAFVDANLLIRFLTCDTPDRAEATRRLLVKAAAGDVVLHIADLAFAEVVWVLEKVCKWPRADITAHLPALIGLDGVIVERASVLCHAFSLHGALNIDFIDAYQGALAMDAGVPAIYSKDEDLDRVPGVQRLEP